MTVISSGGPYFDELVVGGMYDSAPAVTITDGIAAVHHSILGSRLRLPLDVVLSQRVTGQAEPLVHPALLCDIAIGQSTLVTQRVIANLFYRGLRFHRFVHIGDTLHTRTEVVALRENSTRPDRAATGLAALRITSVDQNGTLVLDFHRCAMLPLSPNPDANRVRYADDMAAVGDSAHVDWVIPGDWDLDAYRERTGCASFVEPEAGTVIRSSGDVVSSAPELARLSTNIAAVHHDRRERGSRLVYGGHTIGLAAAQVSRAFPDMIGVLGWISCDHTGPVHEGDTLTSDVSVEAVHRSPRGSVVHLRSIVRAHRPDGAEADVLDWRFVALMP